MHVNWERNGGGMEGVGGYQGELTDYAFVCLLMR